MRFDPTSISDFSETTMSSQVFMTPIASLLRGFPKDFWHPEDLNRHSIQHLMVQTRPRYTLLVQRCNRHETRLREDRSNFSSQIPKHKNNSPRAHESMFATPARCGILRLRNVGTLYLSYFLYSFLLPLPHTVAFGILREDCQY